MANPNSDVIVRYGSDVGPLKKGSKEAGRTVKEFGKISANVAKQVAAVGAAAAAAAGAVVAMAKASADDARELSILARVSGTTTTHFKNLAVATKSVGIEQDKLADIFKDMQDRVGDFLATGGGPMVDFFEQIAPQVGVTAEQFRKLSGPEALQLYVDSLEKANLSQSEMIFFMEAIASDSSQLLPLLQNNGQALGNLAEQAAAVNGELSEFDIQSLELMNQELDRSFAFIKALRDGIAKELAPLITDLAGEFNQFAGDTQNAASNTLDVVELLAKGVAALAIPFRGIHVLIKGIMVGVTGIGQGLVKMAELAARTIDTVLIKPTLTNINDLIDGINALNPFGQLERIQIGQNPVVTFIQDIQQQLTDTANNQLADLHNLLMQPLPTDNVDAYFDRIRQRAQETQEFVGLPEIPDEPVTTGDQEREKEVTAVRDHNAKLLKLEQDFHSSRLALQSSFTDQWNELSDEQRQGARAGTRQLFADLISLQDSGSRKLFEIAKAAAIGETIFNTFAAAQGAYKAMSSIPFVGPALGIAAAAAAIASGLTRLNAIKNTQFGSSTAGAGGAGGEVAAPVPTPDTPATGGGGGGGGQDQTLTLEGISPEAMFSGESVRMLAERLIEFQRDGGRVVLV